MKTSFSPLFGALLIALTTTAVAETATPTDKASKGWRDYFSYSGTVAYRYDYYHDNGHRYMRQRYRAAANVAFQPIDAVSLNARFIGGSGTRSYTSSHHYNYSSRGSRSNNDFKVSLSNLYVTYTGLPDTKIRLGKVGMRSPWTVGKGTIGGENVGEGIIVDNTFGVVKTQLGYFNNQNFDTPGSSLRNRTKHNGEKIDGNENVIYALASAKLPYVTVDAGYLKVQDTLDSYTIGAVAKHKLDKVKLQLNARHTNLSFDGDDASNTLTKFGIGAKYGIWGAKLAYGFTGEQGGFVAIDSDATGWYQSNLESAAFNLNKKSDASLLKANINVNVTPKVNLSYDFNKYRLHANAKRVTSLKDHSWSAKITYKHDKHFDAYFKYDYVGRQSSQGKRGRIQLRYKF